MSQLITRRPITPAELRVIRSAAEGKSAAETGRELKIPVETVKSQRRRVLAKFGARNMTQAVALAYELGFFHRGAIEEEINGAQIGAYKTMCRDLALLRGVERPEVEREALAAASLRLGRQLTSVKDHTRKEAYDTLDWLDDRIKDAKTGSVIAEHRSGE